MKQMFLASLILCGCAGQPWRMWHPKSPEHPERPLPPLTSGRTKAGTKFLLATPHVGGKRVVFDFVFAPKQHLDVLPVICASALEGLSGGGARHDIELGGGTVQCFRKLDEVVVRLTTHREQARDDISKIYDAFQNPQMDEAQFLVAAARHTLTSNFWEDRPWNTGVRVIRELSIPDYRSLVPTQPGPIEFLKMTHQKRIDVAREMPTSLVGVAVGGDVSETEVRDWLAAFPMESHPRKKPADGLLGTPLDPVIVHRPNSLRTWIFLAWAVDGREVHPVLLERTGEVLAGLLYARLRSQRADSYAVYSSNFEADNANVLTIGAAFGGSDPTSVLREIKSLLPQILRMAVAIDFDVVRVRVHNTIFDRLRSPESTAAFLSEMLDHGPNAYLKKQESGLAKLGAWRVDDLASKYLRAEDVTVVLVGDARRIKAEFLKNGFGVEVWGEE